MFAAYRARTMAAHYGTLSRARGITFSPRVASVVLTRAKTTLSLPPPSPNQPYMHISALQAGNLDLPMDIIVQGQPRTYCTCPSLSFYVKHSASDHHFIFDLGIRRDLKSYPAGVRKYYLESGLVPCEVPQSVAESCEKGGVDPARVKMIVLSHLHWDHIGDHTPFTNATFILGGDGKALLAGGYPGNPNSHTLTTSIPADRTRFLTEGHFTTSIGPFPRAHDLFGDGSTYIIDTPGHCPGHITLLVRTSADGAWLYFGADVAHDTRLLTDEETQFARTEASGVPCCVHSSPELAAIDIGRARELVKMPRVEFIIAHDRKWYTENIGKAFLPRRFVPKS